MRTRDLVKKALADGGITIDPETNDPAVLTEGYIVGIGKLGKSLWIVGEDEPEMVHYSILGRLLDSIPVDAEHLYVGAWASEGMVFWEVSEWYANWGDAMLAAIAGRQETFWDVANEVAIPAYNEND